MHTRSDTELVQQAVQGNRPAFDELIERHREPVRRLIRYLAGPTLADDLFQETLLHAWLHLSALRDPECIRPWLLQVARNRCRDFFKRGERREHATADTELAFQINRMGRHLTEKEAAAFEIREGLERMPLADRELLGLFYLEGANISELATRFGRPEGTIKRQLHHARNRLRQLFTEEERKKKMSAEKNKNQDQPFPTVRPHIHIEPVQAKPFAVDCAELRWWFGRPLVGEKTLWATYDPPEWKLTSATRMRGTRKARVHDLACVEIEVDEWEPDKGWKANERTTFGRLTDDEVQWLAICRTVGGERRLSTFLDETFQADWGKADPRHLSDGGRFLETHPGVFQRRNGDPGAIGAGIYSVCIGSRHFTCLRVIDVEEKPTEQGILVEAYVEETGRTVLFRRYNGRLWRLGNERPPWDEALPEQGRLTIDGVVFIHWYDCLTDLACGLT